jgi:putative hydrolases of HD superfamily
MSDKDPWLEDLLALKRSPRTGWFRIGVDRPESVADHSFAVGLLAWREARARGLDAEKALLMGLLHDFHEARLGDIPSPVKRRLEAAGLADAERMIMDEQWGEWAPEMLELLDELTTAESPEARLVHEMDGAEMRHQARRYLTDGHAAAGDFLPDGEEPA